MTVFQSEGQVQSINRPTNGALAMPRGITLYGNGDMETYGEVWKRQPNVRLVTGFLARNIAQLGLHAFDRVSDNERRRLGPETDLAQFIRHPNPFQTRYKWTQNLVLDLKIYDLFVGLKLRNKVTGKLAVFRIPPYMVSPVGGDDAPWLYADEYEIKGTKSKLTVNRDQVVVMHGYNPTDPRTGVSPIETLRRILAEEAASSKWREQYWRNAARMSGIIERPNEAPKWSDTARARFRSDFQSLYAGESSLAGATPVLEEGMTWKAASFSSKDSEYIDARRLSKEEVASYYYVSPLFVGILENANFSNVSEQHKHLYQDTLGPDLVDIEEEFELQLLPEFDVDQDKTYLEFNLAEKMKGTFEEQATVIQTLTGAPVLTRNESRARLNLPPIEGGDTLVTPLNVLIGGQASPRDTAPVPGTAALELAPAPVGSGVKSIAIVTPLDGWKAKHVEVVGAFFARQKASVMSKLGAGQDVDAAFQADRWNGELEADLFALASTQVADIGATVAQTLGSTFDVSLTDNYLSVNARIASENINNATKTSIETAMTAGEASRTKGVFDAILSAAVTAVFDYALGGRTEEISTTRSTFCGMFATKEAAHQAGVPSKVWRVNASNPREGHPSDGETVGIDDVFSNGARWPGDAEAGPDQSAGCTCSMELSMEEA